MKIGIMQPYFFPYFAYWQLINAVDRYLVYDDVTFIKGGWISRNNILLNGEAHMITLPLSKPSSFKKIKDICINPNEKLVQKVIKTINSAYCKAPYYDDIMPLIERLMLSETMISDLNYHAILEICKLLGINTEIILASEIEKDETLTGKDKVISIVKSLGGDRYINAIGGVELYSPNDFRKQGIDLKFLKMDHFTYGQFGNSFVPNLSIIDVLMFNSIQETKDLLSRYALFE